MKKLTKQKIQNLTYIISRNVFILVNGIIFAVVIFLYIFGDIQSALFLGFILLLNISLGLVQDLRAFFALENLQLLTAPHVVRIEVDKSETSILVEEIKKDDLIRLRTGDQIPCDGTLLESHALELNEGLLTGESASIPHGKDDKVLAGSVITSGSGVMRIDIVFNESHIARMTEGVKTYSVNMSPIQKDVNILIKYSGYLLIAVIVFVIARGMIVGEANVDIVKNIGALTSTLVPQGLAFAMTLLFAYGAAHLFNRNVLLQEINATEKLGRIKNLCMDKTGTLTENTLTVERLETFNNKDKDVAQALVKAYLLGAKENSQTIIAIDKYLGAVESPYTTLDVLSFSSWRQYGAVKVQKDGKSSIIIAGSSEAILNNVKDEKEKAWLNNFLMTETKQAKRIFAVAESQAPDINADLSKYPLSIVAVFIIASTLRPGIKEAIDFFQKRGVRLHIISGDSPETVRSISQGAGVMKCEALITGAEMKQWSVDDFMKKAKDYTIFARTLPEQKGMIIDSLKQSGFTAMVGDGANDTLALKKADIGIAMFEGSQAARQVSSVVLMNNSFTALPGGVELADSIIKNAEIIGSVFLYPAFSGIFFFIIVSLLGHPFPFTPLNITLINYFTVGIPGILISYWTLFPSDKTAATDDRSFLKKTLPFVISSALMQAIILGGVFLVSQKYFTTLNSNIFLMMMFIITGFIFFVFVVKVYRGTFSKSQIREIIYTLIVEALVLFGILKINFFIKFFDIRMEAVPVELIAVSAVVVLVFTVLQYFIKRRTA